MKLLNNFRWIKFYPIWQHWLKIGNDAWNSDLWLCLNRQRIRVDLLDFCVRFLSSNYVKSKYWRNSLEEKRENTVRSKNLNERKKIYIKNINLIDWAVVWKSFNGDRLVRDHSNKVSVVILESLCTTNKSLNFIVIKKKNRTK